jgi:hypothetical protein
VAETCAPGFISVNCPVDQVVPDGTACVDDDLCNGEEICTFGVCAAAAEPLDCNDGDHPAPEQTEQVRNELLHALLHGLHEPKPRVRWRSDP